MLQYLTPITLEEMYNDLDEARLGLLREVNKNNLLDKTDEYRKLTDLIAQIDEQYKIITGEDLWVKAAMAEVTN